MRQLKQASRELFRRTPDEAFPSVESLLAHCRARAERSDDLWRVPQALAAVPDGGALVLDAGDGGSFRMNDWSFTQLCSHARVSKDTVNRLSPETAGRVFEETLPWAGKPVQLFAEGERLRSLHGVGYTRLHNAEVLTAVCDAASGFSPPPEGADGKTGLYAGEQDMFCFLIDPAGWAEVGGEAFAPGFFVWNSEVGRRSVGVSTFWFQAVCRNHIVWDATDVVELTRRHTGNVRDALSDIRGAVEALVRKRDERRDGFARVIRKAMEAKLGDDAEGVLKALGERGITRSLGRAALELAGAQGRFTIWSVVDALTRLSGKVEYAGDRLLADQRAAGLLSLAA